MIIRDALPSDKDAWLVLWQGFLDYYDHALDPAITAFTWVRLMDPGSPMKMRVAEEDGLLAFATYQHHPSTWVMGDDCYLEDLFVSPVARGKGVGRAMMTDLLALTRRNGWHRLYWHTNHDNTVARGLYESIIPPDGNIRYRISVT